MSESAVLVVIVNYRTAGLAIESLRSLSAEMAKNPQSSVVVVDNASGDGSEHALAAAIEAERWGDWATLVCAPVNGGFSYGNNLAVRPALSGRRYQQGRFGCNGQVRICSGIDRHGLLKASPPPCIYWTASFRFSDSA